MDRTGLERTGEEGRGLARREWMGREQRGEDWTGLKAKESRMNRLAGRPTVAKQKSNTNGTTQENVTIRIKPIKFGRIEVYLLGETPVMFHPFPMSVILDLANRGTEAHEKRQHETLRAKFINSMYWLDVKNDCRIEPNPKADDAEVAKATFGIPCCSLRATAIAACRQVDGISMTAAKGMFQVLGAVAGQYVPIISPPPKPFVAEARTSTGVPMPTCRGQFWPWGCVAAVVFNAAVITGEQIVNLFNIAGFASGLGEWRPSSPKSMTGTFGRFKVISPDEFATFRRAQSAK